jgi:hypothetical protein
MEDNTFAITMGKIVAQAEAEQVEEVRALRRHQIFDRVRGIVAFLIIAAALFSALHYRGQIQSFLLSKVTSQTSNGASASIKAAQNNAAARDKALDEISK